MPSFGSSENGAALAWAPFPDRETARNIAQVLLTERLIACANILGSIESVFEWNGEASNEEEIGVLFKTTSQLLDGLVERLGELHPYDTPAVLGWRCDAALPATLEWLNGVLSADRPA